MQEDNMEEEPEYKGKLEKMKETSKEVLDYYRRYSNKMGGLGTTCLTGFGAYSIVAGYPFYGSLMTAGGVMGITAGCSLEYLAKKRESEQEIEEKP